MEVRVVAFDDEQYLDFVARFGTVFNSREWLSIYGNSVEVYGVYNGKELVASFFIYRTKLKGMFNVLIPPPFTPDNSLVADNDFDSIFKYNNFNKKVLTAVSDFMLGQRVSYVEFAMPDTMVDTQPFIWGGFRVRPKYSYLLDLSLSEEKIYDNINPKIRSSHIQKAIKDGVKAELNKDYGIVRSLVIGTFTRQGKVVNERYLDKILFEFATASNSYSYVSYYEGLPSAAIFVVYDSKRAYCLLSGFSDSNEHRGAGTLVHYEAIMHAKRLGVAMFDLEGSMIMPVENFYRGFGGRLVSKFVMEKKSSLFSVLSILRK